MLLFKTDVLMAGLEPARLSARDFKSLVSAIPPHQRTGVLYHFPHCASMYVIIDGHGLREEAFEAKAPSRTLPKTGSGFRIKAVAKITFLA